MKRAALTLIVGATLCGAAAIAAAPTGGQDIPAPTPNRPVLEIRALDKITGRARVLYAPVGQPVKYATLSISVRSCYSTPASETPETSAFLQISDQRADRPAHRVFSGWMYASSPGLNGMEHPLYDVWVIKCMTSAPSQIPSAKPAVPVSPNKGADEKMPELPEDAGQ